MSGQWTDDHGCTHWCSTYYSGMGCLGVLFSCGHSFSCAADPAAENHSCASRWTNALWSLLMMLVVVAVIVAARS